MGHLIFAPLFFGSIPKDLIMDGSLISLAKIDEWMEKAVLELPGLGKCCGGFGYRQYESSFDKMVRCRYVVDERCL